MRKIMKLTTALIMALVCFNIVAAASAVNVRLIALTRENRAMNVYFEYSDPVAVEGISMVPVREACEDAGMNVLWDGNSQSVVIKLNAHSDSDLPIERYAYELLTQKAIEEQQNISPEYIALTVYKDSDVAELHYNYTDLANSTVSYGKSLKLARTVTIDEYGIMIAPIRSLFTSFGLEIGWTEEHSMITVNIPEFVQFSENMEIVDAYDPEYEEGADSFLWDTEAYEAKLLENVIVEEFEYFPEESVEYETSENKVYLGNFRISHYCPCVKCNGSYGAVTAWAGDLEPGRTIAVDPSVISKLATVEIEGYGLRVAEDCGGAIKGNRIDVAVATHEEAMRRGVVYRDVWVVQ